MKKSNNLKRVYFLLSGLIILNLVIIGILSKNALASKIEEVDSPGWNIQLRPNVLFGSDGRVLYVMDMNVPLYRGENNLLFAAPKYTPNNDISYMFKGFGIYAIDTLVNWWKKAPSPSTTSTTCLQKGWLMITNTEAIDSHTRSHPYFPAQ